MMDKLESSKHNALRGILHFNDGASINTVNERKLQTSPVSKLRRQKGVGGLPNTLTVLLRVFLC